MPFYLFLGEGSPTKIDDRKKSGTPIWPGVVVWTPFLVEDTWAAAQNLQSI